MTHPASGQQQALGQQVTNELSARRAQRQPDRHLLRAGGPAHEQQRRQVAARDRQHEPDDDEQHRRDGRAAGRPSADGCARRSTRTPRCPCLDPPSGTRRPAALPRMCIAACACATVTPSRRRAFTKNAASSGRRSSARGGAPSAGSDEIGSQKSVTMPMLIVPRWPAGPTPTIVTGTPSIRMVRPTTDGSAPKLPRPGLVPDDGHDRGAGRVLRRVEPAPERRLQSQHGQIRRGGVFDDRRPQARRRPGSSRREGRTRRSCSRRRRCTPPCPGRPGTSSPSTPPALEPF